MSEENVTTTTSSSRTIRNIVFGPFNLNQQEVIDAFQDHSSITTSTHNNETIILLPVIHFELLCFDDNHMIRFSETLEMRDAIVENENIERFVMYNCCKNNDYFAWFNFFVRFILQSNNDNANYDTTHFEYHNNSNDCNTLSVDHANQLAHAIQSINENGRRHHIIETFSVEEFCNSIKAFQVVWNALLNTNIQQLRFDMCIDYKVNTENDSDNKNGINCTNLSTNTTLKRLDFVHYGESGPIIGQQHYNVSLTNIFHAIKVNHTHAGLEELRLETYDPNFCNKENLVMSFKEMLRWNITLLTVLFEHHAFFGDENDNDVILALRNVITIETEINRNWKRVVTKRKERIASATAAATNSNNNNDTVVVDASSTNTAIAERRNEQDKNEIDKKIKEEKNMRRKKEEMVICLFAFTKPLMRNELIYLFLTENADMYDVR